MPSLYLSVSLPLISAARVFFFHLQLCSDSSSVLDTGELGRPFHRRPQEGLKSGVERVFASIDIGVERVRESPIPVHESPFAINYSVQIDINPIMASYASANMGRRINVAFISSESYFLQQQLPPPTPRRHAIFIFLVPLLLKFLQLQCQGQVASQFETHPKTMFVAITSLIVYFFAYDAELRSSLTEDYGPVVISRVKEVSGLLCLLSFALVLFPDSVRVILYLLYILFLAPKFVHCKLQMLWNWLHQRVISRFLRERCVRRVPINRRFWFMTPASANGRYLLPLYQ